MKASDVAQAIQKPEQQRIFRTRGEGEYSLEVLPAGIEFFVSRLRRTSNELHGELTASVMNGHFPKAHTIDGNVLSSADMNFSSAQTRVQRAKLFKDRCGPAGEAFDWVGFMEELSVKMIQAERQGEPAIALEDVPINVYGQSDSWVFDGFPVLRRHPTVLFAKDGSGKSYFAMWLAGRIALEGTSVLYLDWELDGEDHKKRFERLFQPVPRKKIFYIKCQTPLRDQIDRIQRLIHEQHFQFAVFDSIAPASRMQGGRFQEGDLGQEYFGLVRRLGVGSLHVAHPPKTVTDEKDATISGSCFFNYLARSVWFIQRAANTPKGELLMGFTQQKLTTGARQDPTAYRLIFDGDERVRVERADLTTSEDLVATLPLIERMKILLTREGPMTPAAIAQDLDIKQNVIRMMVSRHRSVFVKAGTKIDIRHVEAEF